MKTLIAYILIGLGTVAFIRHQTFQIEQTSRDVASVYMALHPTIKTKPTLYGSFLNDMKSFNRGAK